MTGTDEDVLLINVANLIEACADPLKTKRPAQVYVCVSVCVCMYVCMYVCVCVCVCVCACV